MKEAEVDALVMPWANARVAQLLSVHRMMPVEIDDGQKKEVSINDYDHLMYTQKADAIEPFSSLVIPVRAYMGECINVMVQALQTGDGSLPQGLTVQNTYTELRQGSKTAVIVVRNNTAYLQTLWKKSPVARVVVASTVPEPLRVSNCWRGLKSPMIPIPLSWQLGKDMVNCLMN